MIILKAILNNLDNILVVAVLLAILAVFIIKFVTVSIPKWKAMPEEERVAYLTRLLHNLIPIAINLVTDAEFKYGGGTGLLKKSKVIDELYSRIPDEYKKYVTVANLESILNDALEEAKELWKSKPEIENAIKHSSTNEIVIKTADVSDEQILKIYERVSRAESRMPGVQS